MTTIGQNSPATPEPSTAEPSGVGSRPASARIGTSVPSAVVRARRRAATTRRPGRLRCSTRPTSEPDRERDRPADRAADERTSGHALLDDLQPGEEEQEARGRGWRGTRCDCRPPRCRAPRGRSGSRARSRAPPSAARAGGAASTGSPRRSPRRGRGRASRRRQRRLRREREVADHLTRPGAIPHVLVNESPGSRRISDSPLRNAFGGHVIGSTARLRRSTSGSGSPVKSIR